MLNHSSATPHTIKSTKKKRLKLNGTSGAGTEVGAGSRSRKTTSNALKRRNGTFQNTISSVLKRHAQEIIKDRSIDAETRAIIRYGLEINDPWLPELVRRADAGETLINEEGLFANMREGLLANTRGPGKLIQAKKRLKH